jgi:hypothetical protein
MAIFNAMFPVLPGKEDAAREFAAAVMGERNDDFRAQQGRADVSRETWTLQETPMGSVLLVWFDGDIEKAFGELATGEDDFTVWFRASVLDVSGFDVSAPDDSPPPEVVLDWTA